ncbi:MAG: GNAT family N-acetyltransferase [Streptosporangiaceae bacterium]|nr:GNAT family N-acetyltransferase [Streptosporangiaceae bacterium]
MPWVVRDVVNDINKAVGRRWRSLDPLLPAPGQLPQGCGAPLVVTGTDGRAVGLGACVHQPVPPGSLNQTWGAATRFILTPRLGGQDTAASLGALLSQWRDHLAGVAAAHEDDTAAFISWPTRDITGVRALLRHGLQPLTVVAARTRPGTARSGTARSGNPPGTARSGNPPGTAWSGIARSDSAPGGNGRPPAPPGVTIRRAGPLDVDTVFALEMGVIEFDAHFGGPVKREATAELLYAEVRASLERPEPAWTWLAERGRRPVALLVTQPPPDARWISGMTRRSPAAYLQTMFVIPEERGGGVGTALVRCAHRELDAWGIDVTLLHHSQVNPLSGPFWYRMGYRPLWTTWEARPALSLRGTPRSPAVTSQGGNLLLVARNSYGKLTVFLKVAEVPDVIGAQNWERASVTGSACRGSGPRARPRRRSRAGVPKAGSWAKAEDTLSVRS